MLPSRIQTEIAQIKEASKEHPTAQLAVPPSLPQKHKSVLDEIENPEAKERKESKVSKRAKKVRDMEAGA